MTDDPLQRQLFARFGLASFRPWQREAIEALLEGPKRVLVVAPTGGGKSLTYQFPATLLEGVAVIVSPLIALMEDQVRGLEERGIAATFLASSISFEERRQREEGIEAGRYELVYVAPESLGSERMRGLLRRVRPKLIAIDEAHCISQWGHDFRPDYMRLGQMLRALQPEHVLACTATATPVVREEILERLGLEGATTILRGFARPNLHLSAAPVDRPRVQRERMKAALREALGSPKSPRGAAIVYAGTRKNTERLEVDVRGLGYRSAAYHAGMDGQSRAKVNAAFGAGELDVVCATNAFGMGIDRADIRLVVHVGAPSSIEAYYQEVGRAGRDGEPAKGLLLTSAGDYGLRRNLAERSRTEDPGSEERVERKWQLFLDLMRYAEAGSCRHDFILRYFGDDEELLGGCGHCDVCARLEEEGDASRSVSPEDAQKVRMALSGLARTRGRVGIRAVAQSLAGKSNKSIERWGFDRLSTHGLLKDQGEDWVVALLRRLITAGLASIRGGDYPLVHITTRGVQVMKGDEPVRVLPPETARSTSGRRKRAPVEVTGTSRGLFERLREARMNEAKRHGVPAYVVATDRTLAAIADARPQDAASLRQVPGMGPARVASYGDALLAAID